MSPKTHLLLVALFSVAVLANIVGFQHHPNCLAKVRKLQLRQQSGRALWNVRYATYFQELPAGNCYANYVGFRPDRGADQVELCNVHYAAVNAFYPRRLYVTTEDVVLNNAAYIVQHNNIPTISWLHAQEVTTILEIRREKDTVNFKQYPVPAP